MTEEKFIKDVISKCRKEKQLTQEQLADLLNVSNKTVSKWERGISYPDITLIPMLAKVLDINISDLFNVQETLPRKSFDNDNVYNIRIINNFRLFMFISFITFIFGIVLPFLVVAFLQNRLMINFGYMLSAIFIIISLSFASLASYQYYCFFSNKLYQRRYAMVFIKNGFTYLLLIYISLMFFISFVLKNSYMFKLFLLIIHLIIGILPHFFIKRFKSINFNKKITILGIISILLFIFGYLMCFVNRALIYTIILILSQIINYLLTLKYCKNINIEGE